MAFRSSEELRAELAEVERKRAALFTEHKNTEARAQTLEEPDDGLRERLARINQGIAKLDTTKQELEAEIGRLSRREEELRKIAQNPGAQEAGVEYPEPRTREEQPLLGATAGAQRDRAMRTVERYQKSGELRSEAADRLDGVLRKGDPLSQGARWLDAVGDPDYKSAFGKLVEDPTTGHLRFTPK